MTTIQGRAPAALGTIRPIRPVDRPSRLVRLLELSGPALASVATAFGAPAGSYSLAAVLTRHRAARRSR